MYRIVALIYALNLVLMTVGCRKTKDLDVEYRPGFVEKTSKDFLIPRNLKSDIEQKYLQFIRIENPKVVLTDEELLARIPREFLDIQVYLYANSSGVLVHNTKFIIPRGGGEIDLKDYVKGSKGSFYLKIGVSRSNQSDIALDKFHVFFLSEAKERKIQGEKFGAGCKKYMDISRFISNANAAEGVLLNATDQRYLSVVGGIFYFVNFDSERKIYLGALRLSDSRYTNILCEQPNL
ncbi:MAG: hypothetical protein A2Z20_11550 [Bdellovibrionales bacterium RBG_16_40_8]|nr:MAG: hypothetical protein A2Z20_11550 [Bdellovibrionales bacterium RBG_16_40_8]